MTTTQFGAHPTGTDAADHTEHDARGDGLLALIAGRRAGAGRRSFLSSARGRTVLSFDDLWGEVGRWGRWLDHHVRSEDRLHRELPRHVGYYGGSVAMQERTPV